MRNVSTRLWASCVVFAATGCGESGDPRAFNQAIRNADRVVLYEGLPRLRFSSGSVKQDRPTVPMHNLAGYSFFKEPLPLTDADADRLTRLMADPAIQSPFSGEKRCGGFNPDYAIEWQRGSDRYLALICFACQEMKLIEPAGASRYDWGAGAAELRAILETYRTHRPEKNNRP